MKNLLFIILIYWAPTQTLCNLDTSKFFLGEILNHCTPREPASLSDFNRQFVTIRRDFNSWPCHEIYYYFFFYGKKSASSLSFLLDIQWIARHMNFMHVNLSLQATKIWSLRELHTEWMIMIGPFCIQFAKKKKIFSSYYLILRSFFRPVCLIQSNFFCFLFVPVPIGQSILFEKSNMCRNLFHVCEAPRIIFYIFWFFVCL